MWTLQCFSLCGEKRIPVIPVNSVVGAGDPFCRHRQVYSNTLPLDIWQDLLNWQEPLNQHQCCLWPLHTHTHTHARSHTHTHARRHTHFLQRWRVELHFLFRGVTLTCRRAPAALGCNTMDSSPLNFFLAKFTKTWRKNTSVNSWWCHKH